ncbi:DNA repair protein RAD51-like [Gracilariopsis chorda]|uniref:DNA repair protein RAD51-like n=1 Tax=Gracilariopsis chorda TaxID=448386 RepID=A0A2V3IJN5_9FLOR|nr:DNA repair protein RAD51-like [Gracilariopsis chorda]|eukprot:PXF42306.1 DNA repair protein RAD51-like [Gracilariopsis chorda]
MEESQRPVLDWSDGPTVPTMHFALDTLLQGGLPRGSITEVYSTNLSAAHLLHTVAVSSCRGRGALLIDTRGTPAAHLLQIAKSRNLPVRSPVSVFRVFTFADACALLHALPSWISTRGAVDFIGLDCMADLFYTCQDNSAKRMEGFVNRLRGMSIQFNAAVLITNAARVHQNRVTTVMGEQWHHVCANRLHMQQNPSCIRVVKSILTEPKIVPYQLTEAGVID